ncbi:MAG: rhodanese-like domain-containing protein [Desulfurellaceae bacterium]|nr:rhodanese-like domain-containing protein [Desulfurellaceae bacterium]
MPVKQTTPPQAYQTLSSDPSVIYLDVRTDEEFTAGHPEGAINIPVIFFDMATRQPSPNPHFQAVVEANIAKGVTVIVGCQAGGRSQRAAEIMQQAGYSDVTNMQGGFGGGQTPTGQVIAGWRDVGLPISADNGDGVSYASLAAKAGLAS